MAASQLSGPKAIAALVQPDRPVAARIAAGSLLGAPFVFWAIEYYVKLGYQPSYSYFGNFTSDLAVPYPHIERTYNRPAHSTRARYMKFNFLLRAATFAIGNAALLRARGGGVTALAVTRAAVVALYTWGLYLVAIVPGGNREHESGEVKWHSLGAMLTIFCGNLSAILSGLADSNPSYRRTTVAIGSAGIVNLVIFVLRGRTNMKGFWQRAAINCSQGSELITGYAVLSQLTDRLPLLFK